MVLNQTAEYSFRAMAALAGLAPGESIAAPALAERTGIPVHYLSKVMRKLVLGKLVRGQKGHGGGFQLARAPGSIRFAEILAVTDQYPAPDRCGFGWGTCDPRNPCPLHPAWSRLNEAFQRWAESMTLADVTLPGAELLDRMRTPTRRKGPL